MRLVSKISGEDYSPQSLSDGGVNVLMIGTGEYTTGYVNGRAADSDKSCGFVALTLMDLKRRKKTGRLSLCGVNGTKFPGIRQHLLDAIAKKYPASCFEESIKGLHTFPADGEVNEKAYVHALSTLNKGDAAIIFTPDDTHFEIALQAIRRGVHVLITKPVVKTLAHHAELAAEAEKHNVLCCVEVHKRWDPMYVDARDRIRALGPFSFLQAYMSQPKHQLETFKAWAGVSSDISYYLNSHHIDFHEWTAGDRSRPVRVTACASTGVAKGLHGMDCEDTITLTVQWENLENPDSPSLGTALYTSSWIAPKSDVHSQQRFFYMGHSGELHVDQAHRGYHMAADDGLGFRSVNPLFMKYTPTDGHFSGQGGYGYRSIEAFVDAVEAVNSGKAQVRAFDEALASIHTTLRTTAILEAGRRSLDEGRTVDILYDDSDDKVKPTRLQ
jgi:D-galacturonate reductase